MLNFTPLTVTDRRCALVDGICPPDRGPDIEASIIFADARSSIVVLYVCMAPAYSSRAHVHHRLVAEQAPLYAASDPLVVRVEHIFVEITQIDS
jgi:hypothetical protein